MFNLFQDNVAFIFRLKTLMFSMGKVKEQWSEHFCRDLILQNRQNPQNVFPLSVSFIKYAILFYIWKIFLILKILVSYPKSQGAVIKKLHQNAIETKTFLDWGRSWVGVWQMSQYGCPAFTTWERSIIDYEVSFFGDFKNAWPQIVIHSPLNNNNKKYCYYCS